MYDELFRLFNETIQELDFDQASIILRLLEKLDKSQEVDLRHKLAEIQLHRLVSFTFEKKMTQELFDEIKELGDPELFTKAIIELAYAPLYTGNLVRVENLCQRYESLILEHGSIRTKGNFYNVFGTYYAHQGMMENAIEYFSTSLKYRTKSGNDYLIAQSYNNLGATYIDSNDYKNAVFYCTKATDISRKFSQDPKLAQSHITLLSTLFDAYIGNGNRKQARTVVEEMRTIYENYNKERRFELPYQWSKASFLYNSNSLLDKMKAKKLFSDLAFSEITNIRYKVRAVLSYSDLCILELEALGSKKALEEVIEAINQLRDVASLRDNLKLKIRANIIRAKLHFIVGKIDQGYKLLEQTKELAEINELFPLKQLIEEEVEQIEENIEQMEYSLMANKKIRDRIRDSKIKEFIDKMRDMSLY